MLPKEKLTIEAGPEHRQCMSTQQQTREAFNSRSNELADSLGSRVQSSKTVGTEATVHMGQNRFITGMIQRPAAGRVCQHQAFTSDAVHYSIAALDSELQGVSKLITRLLASRRKPCTAGLEETADRQSDSA